MQEDGRGITAEREGYDSDESAFLRHRMKYSSHGNNDPLLAIERYTHSMSSANDQNSVNSDTINVSITCSRIPQKYRTARQASGWPEQKSSFMTTSGPVWKGDSNTVNPQILREQNCRKTTTTVSSHPSSRPTSRVSEKGRVYSAVKTDNHRRSTSLPQKPPPLFQPTGLEMKQATMTTTGHHAHHITEPSQTLHSLMPQSSSSLACKYRDSDTTSPVAVIPHSAMTETEEEAEMNPSKSLRVYLSSHIGPSIAPAGVRAVATHQLRPVTSNTIIKGRGLVTGARWERGGEGKHFILKVVLFCKKAIQMCSTNLVL